MSASALLHELLSGFATVDGALSDPSPAKAANPANSDHPCGLTADPMSCEGPRKPANPDQVGAAAAIGSQQFAAVRSADNGVQSKQRRGSSQDSQESQGYPEPTTIGGDFSALVSTSDDVARFNARRARLMRWGWSERDAEALSERLAKRDIDQDDRVSCTDCKHDRPGRCGNRKQADLNVPAVGRDLASMLQRCSGFLPLR